MKKYVDVEEVIEAIKPMAGVGNKVLDRIRNLPPAVVIPERIISELTQMSNALDCQTPCNDMYWCGWCEKNCKWKDPQEECWRKWVEWLQKGELHEKDR